MPTGLDLMLVGVENDLDEPVIGGKTTREFLSAIVAQTKLPLRLRLEAAKILIQYEEHKLSTTQGAPDGGFADRLDRAIKRSNSARWPRLLEYHQPEEES
jgi:hypothetical protein